MSEKLQPYVVYNPIESDLTHFKTLEEARNHIRDLFDSYSEDDVPEEFDSGGVKILIEVEHSRLEASQSREDYREPCDSVGECLYGDEECEKCWHEDYEDLVKLEIVPVEGQQLLLQRWEPGSEPPNGWYWLNYPESRNPRKTIMALPEKNRWVVAQLLRLSTGLALSTQSFLPHSKMWDFGPIYGPIPEPKVTE